MYANGKLLIAKGEKELCIVPKMANRHGLIAGATGTGKTVTLKVMAESFSGMGVPVFLTDIKGDISGTMCPGEMNENITKRVEKLGLTGFYPQQFPVRFWDVFGKDGHSVRATISDIGPLLLSRILDLNDTQRGVLNIAFRVADENGWLLLDLKDLKAMLQYLGQHTKELSLEYGNISRRSVSAIMRSLLTIADQGGEYFFGEPAFDVKDWMQTTYDGKGYINIMDCVQLFQHPALYSTFMLWLLSELYENLPEVGDMDKPKMVFFFDEAHLLFDDAPKVLLQKIEQVVRLIRSKGVGVYFITQSPTDIPDSILAQLGNRVQHALRAYTPAEQKKVKAAADSFRRNPAFKTQDAITELNTGEALISFLDEKGAPSVVEMATILPPQSRLGAASDAERQMNMNNSGMAGKYDDIIDRESAYEILNGVGQQAGVIELEKARRKAAEEERKAALEAEKLAAKEEAARLKALEKEQLARQKAAERELLAQQKAAEKELLAQQKAAEKAAAAKKKKIEQIVTAAAASATTQMLNSTIKRPVTKGQSALERSINSAINSTVTNVGRQASKSLVRGVLGNLLK